MPEVAKKSDLKELARKKRHLYLVEKLQKGQPLSKKEIDELGEFENEPKKHAKPWIVDTQKEVAEAIGVSVRRIRYMKRAGMPVEEDGRYNVVLIERWRHRHNESNDKWESKSRELKYKTAEVKFRQMTGELIDREEVEKGRVERIMAVKSAMFQLPRSVAVMLANIQNPREIETYLTEKMREICNTFAGT